MPCGLIQRGSYLIWLGDDRDLGILLLQAQVGDIRISTVASFYFLGFICICVRYTEYKTWTTQSSPFPAGRDVLPLRPLHAAPQLELDNSRNSFATSACNGDLCCTPCIRTARTRTPRHSLRMYFAWNCSVIRVGSAKDSAIADLNACGIVQSSAARCEKSMLTSESAGSLLRMLALISFQTGRRRIPVNFSSVGVFDVVWSE